MQELYLQERDICVRKNVFQAERKTIIFIHGLAGSSSAWRQYEHALQGSFNILSYDIRGHGKSSRHENYEDYHFSNFSKDLEYIVTYFSLEKFILVSHSFGTFVALDYMLNHGDKVEQSVLLAPGFNPYTKILTPAIDFSILTTQLARKMFPVPPKKSHVDYSARLMEGDWNIERMIADIQNTGFLVYLFCFKQAAGVVYDERLQTIDCPVLILHGKKDTVLSHTRSEKIHASLKNSQLVLLDEANHVLVFSHFDEVMQHISKFLKTV